MKLEILLGPSLIYQTASSKGFVKASVRVQRGLLDCLRGSQQITNQTESAFSLLLLFEGRMATLKR